MTDEHNSRSQRKMRDRIIELRRVRAGDLRPNPRNWRRHPESQRRALKALLREVGYADALLAREQDGGLLLLDGHLRSELDDEQIVPVLVTDLTEEEGDKLLLTLDPLATLAQPDPDALAKLLETVDTASAAVRELLAGLARQARLPMVVGFTDPDDVPTGPEPRSGAGDIWALGDHRLVCGDATKPEDLALLMDGRTADLLWCDPPWGVSYRGKTPRALTIRNDGAAGIGDLLAKAFAAADTVLAPGAPLYVAHPAGPASITFGERFVSQGWRYRQTLIWLKDALVLGRSDYHYRHEPILYGYKPGPGRRGRGHEGWYGGNAESSVFEIPRPKASRDHPTCKPVALVRRCLENSSERGDAVLDVFLGSGTTLIAAEQLGRACFGVEIDPGYVDVALSRWESFTGRTAERVRGGETR